MTQFVDERLDVNVETGAVGGPTFFTSVLDLSNAGEQRNENWAYQRLDWDISYGLQSQAEFDAVLDLFYVTAGRTFGFRFKDWSDFSLGFDISFSVDNQIVLTTSAASSQILGFGDGNTTAFQMFKLYQTQTAVYFRPVTRPVQGTTTIYLDGTPLSEGSDFVVNYDTGVVTFAVAPVSGAVLTFSVQFDVAARFDTDMFKQKVTYANALQVGGIKVVELKEFTGSFNLPTKKLQQPVAPIQFSATSAVGTPDNQYVCFSPDRKTAYFWNDGSGSTAGVHVVDMTILQETNSQAIGSLFTTGGLSINRYGHMIGTDGNLYVVVNTGSTPVVKVGIFDLVQDAILTSSDISNVSMMIPFKLSGTDMFVCVCGSTSHGVGMFNADTMTEVGTAGSVPGNISTPALTMCPGSISGGTYTAYGLVGNPTNGNVDLYSFACTASGVTPTLVHSYPFTAFDINWTTYNGFGGPIYDQSDGNLLIIVEGFGASSTNLSYLCKINASTGAIMWQKGFTNSRSFTAQGVMNAQQTVNGTLFLAGFNAGNTFSEVNTTTGTETDTVVTGLSYDSFTNYYFTAGYGTYLFHGSLSPYMSSQWGVLSPYGSVLLRQLQFAEFVDERLDENIETGAEGGPSFLTTVIMLSNAFEGRNQEWQYPLQEWNIKYGVQGQSDFQDIVNMYYVCRGRAAGFRFRDWTDYEIGDPVNYVVTNAQKIGNGTGSLATFQIYKQYNSQTGQFLRPITRPVQGTLEVYVNGAIQTEGVAFTCNYDTGLITFLSGHIPGNGTVVSISVIFDVPVRFDDDQFKQKVTWVDAVELASIKIRELKEFGGSV